MHRRIFRMWVLSAAVLFTLPVAAYAGEATLISKLVGELGVTEKQATGGAGALLKDAQRSLSEADFAKVTAALPEVSDLIKAAPEGMGAGLGGALGKGLQSLGGMAGVAKAFDTLGMKADMVGKFVPKLLSFAEAKGGAPVMKILENVLK